MWFVYGQLTLYKTCAACEQHKSPCGVLCFASSADGSDDTDVVELAYVAVSDELRTRLVCKDYLLP